MTTQADPQREVLSLLEEVIDFEYDTIEAYKLAVNHLADEALRWRVESFLEDHVRHVESLTHEIISLGGTAPEGPDAKFLITTGKVFLGLLLGDRAILGAMRANEGDTNNLYERAASQLEIPSHLRRIFLQHLADERRHRDWFEGRIAQSSREVAQAG